MAETLSNGITIRYTNAGRGEPALLFLPDWCTTRSVFAPLLPPARERHHPISMDFRGHGESDDPTDDFGTADLVSDALAVIEASGVGEVVPVAMSHAGWVALELRRRLGNRIPKLVLLQWIVTEPPLEFREMLKRMQNPTDWPTAVQRLVSIWTARGWDARVNELVNRDMSKFAFPMWARGAREILAQYDRWSSPLNALAELRVPTLHLYAQPNAQAYFATQQSFAAEEPWFQVHRLNARTTFPQFEVPDEVNLAIDRFVGIGLDEMSWISPA